MAREGVVILEPGSLEALARELRGRAELDLKRDIQIAARAFGRASQSAWFPSPTPILNGDDAAALPDGDGFVLFAAEGMRSEFLAADPWFCGFCSVMVNLNDIAAMGGRPWAITDVLFMGTGENERVLEGMCFASEVFGVPIVGGHTSRVPGASFLAVSVLGKAKRLISGHAARAGQTLARRGRSARHVSRARRKLQRRQYGLARASFARNWRSSPSSPRLAWSAPARTSAWQVCAGRC